MGTKVDRSPAAASLAKRPNDLPDRLKEADEFYRQRISNDLSEDAQRVQRQAFAGLLWNKQSYHYDVKRWLDGDSTQPRTDPARRQGRNKRLTTLTRYQQRRSLDA